MDKYKKIVLIAISIIIVVSAAVFIFLFLNKNRIGTKLTELYPKKENVKEGTKEDLIKEKIGDFTIKEENDYQGGKIIKAITQKGEVPNEYTLFYKDGRIQNLPDDYVTEIINSNLSENENKNKTVSFKFHEEFNGGFKDAGGNDVIYYNVFLITKELPESEWDRNSMDIEFNKYQNILVDEYGRFLFKFLSNRII